MWFLAIYLISQAKTCLSVLAFKRKLGVSYSASWQLQQELMQTMAEPDNQYMLGGELTGSAAGNGSENKVRLSWRFRSRPKATRIKSNWLRSPG